MLIAQKYPNRINKTALQTMGSSITLNRHSLHLRYVPQDRISESASYLQIQGHLQRPWTSLLEQPGPKKLKLSTIELTYKATKFKVPPFTKLSKEPSNGPKARSLASRRTAAEQHSMAEKNACPPFRILPSTLPRPLNVAPFIGWPILWLGSPNRKLRQPNLKEGTTFKSLGTSWTHQHWRPSPSLHLDAHMRARMDRVVTDWYPGKAIDNRSFGKPSTPSYSCK